MPPSSDLLLGLGLALSGAALAVFVGRTVPLFQAYEPDPDSESGPPPPTFPGSGRRVPWARWSPLPWRLVATGRAPDGERVRAPLDAVLGAAAAFAAVGASSAQRSAAEVAALAFLALWGAVLAAIDTRTRRLPNPLVLPAYPVALALLAVAALTTPGGLDQAADALVGMAGLWAFYWLLWFVYPAGMGWGDVKLSGLLGLYLGWSGLGSVVSGTFAAFLLSACVGLVLMVLGRVGRGTQIPFGPFMVVGALAVIVVGDPLPLLTG
ncbi:prepilin peptidase [Actinorugispora endophytica]|uniref:Leader peptidase (Prepilin peptidase)/N-methyltransferase n=1 Tax=Actinorugispora endophytica TaxID=1605990 RepID=A0A4R6UYJ0_9ACTN|nr:A24 family peptidase [Actinorugispora endophytica]TDQ52580.1 leader peptidase (prepilin peptidase)/N-methyltransferase [Actinorugispora endophytica]